MLMLGHSSEASVRAPQPAWPRRVRTMLSAAENFAVRECCRGMLSTKTRLVALLSNP